MFLGGRRRGKNFSFSSQGKGSWEMGEGVAVGGKRVQETYSCTT